MGSLTLDRVRIEEDEGTQTLRATLTTKKQPFNVWFRTDKEPINQSPEPFLPVALIPAMRRRWNLHIDGEVSPALLDGTDEIQRVMSGWYRKFRQIHIDAQRKVHSVHEPADAVAVFFSGGVDSFFTLQQHKDEITHLVFVHGFDIRFDDGPRRQEMAQNARQVAEQLQLHLVEVETNLRDFGDRHVSWPDAYFGAGLGAVALLLAPRFKRIYLPASVSTDQMIPFGSHPELDRFWSNGQIEIVHDGVEHNRFEKIQAIADLPLVTRHLRICHGSSHQGYNCGRCRKCLWTMMVLEAIGRLKAIHTLPSEINLLALKQFLPHDKHQRDRFVRSIDYLKARDANPDLQAVLRELVEAGDRDITKGKERERRMWGRISRRFGKLLKRSVK